MAQEAGDAAHVALTGGKMALTYHGTALWYASRATGVVSLLLLSLVVLLGIGAVALDLIAALIITSLVRAHLPRRVWRGTHWLAYAAWPAAFVHSVGTSPDMRSGGFLVLAIICGVGGQTPSWRDQVTPGPHREGLRGMDWPSQGTGSRTTVTVASTPETARRSRTGRMS